MTLPDTGGASILWVLLGSGLVVAGVAVIALLGAGSRRGAGTGVALLVLLVLGMMSTSPLLGAAPAGAATGDGCGSAGGPAVGGTTDTASAAPSTGAASGSPTHAPTSTSTATPTGAPTDPTTAPTTPATTPATTAATTPTPEPFVCPTGIVAATTGGGAVSTTIDVTGNKAGVVDLGSVFSIDASAVDPAVYGSSFTVSQTSSVLSTSLGQRVDALGLGTWTGTSGGVTADPGTAYWHLVSFPNGTYGGAAADPVSLTGVESTYVLGFTSPTTGETISCDLTLRWSVSGRATGRVLLGTGALSYAGTVAAV